MRNVSKRSFAIVLALCLLITMLPVHYAVEAEAVSGVNSLTCASFISDPIRQNYIDTMMRYYINNNSNLANTLDDGDSVVFMFEGGSDNYDSYAYVDAAGSVRVQAVCIVVQKNSSGNAEIVFYSENCSSIPCDANWVTPGYETSGSTTILDGIYAMYNCNHNGNYAAFTTSCSTGWYTPYDGQTGYAGYCNGINIHTRGGNYCGGASYGWANSAGCQVIGYGTSNNAFNEFMKVTTGITWNSYGTYHNTFSSTGYFYGYYVVDRQLGLVSPSGTEYGSGSLAELYTKTDLQNITKFSTNARANADFGYLSQCTYYPSYCEFKTTKSTPINSEPCAAGSNDSETLETAKSGATYTAIAMYRNAAGNLWYQVKTSSGETGYIFSGHTNYVKDFTSDIKLSDATAPNGVVAGDIFAVNGTISSTYNHLDTAAVWIHSGFGTSGSKVTGGTDDVDGTSYSLINSAIDYDTAFNQLTSGKYTYAISTTYTNYYASDETTLGTNTGTVELMTEYFMVIPSDVSQSGCSHSYTTTVMKAATCTSAGIHVESCATCGYVKTVDVPSSGHEYKAVTTSGNCQIPGKTVYTCTCGDTYTVYDGTYTDWSETKPQDVPAELIESKQQYRYADKVYTTSTSTVVDGYTYESESWSTPVEGSVQYVKSWPSGFSTSHSLYSTYDKTPKTDSETATSMITVDSDRVTGYIYYHWCYADSVYSVDSKQGSYTTFHAYYDTTDPDDFTCDPSDMSYKTSHSTCSNSAWWFVAEVNTQSYSTYSKVYNHYKWGNWSAWSDDEVSAADTRKVETRTMYRYVEAPSSAHSYSAVVTAPTCSAGGYTTYTCTACGDSYTSDQTSAVDHSYVNGKCTWCGASEPVAQVDYYLIGYINGVDYGCESDSANMGEYKFVDGKLTATFASDSYVFIKTTDNANWYMTDGWLGTETTTATFYNTTLDIEHNKLFVPGGVEITFTLVVNEDDTLTLSYVAADKPEIEKFDIPFSQVELGNALNMHFLFPVSACDDWTGAYAVITKSYADGRADVTATVPAADWGKENYGADYHDAVFTNIAAKEMADEISIVVYNADGVAISNSKTDSIRNYLLRNLKNDASAELKTLIVDMLNYGAAAQETFGYNTDDLANKDLTAEQKAFGTATMKTCTDKRVKGANFLGTGLELNNSIVLNLYFNGMTSDMTAKVTFTDHNNKPVTADAVIAEGIVIVDQIVVADARQLVTVTVYDANGSVYGTASDSLESCVARASASDTIYQATMKFADSAYAYLH